MQRTQDNRIQSIGEGVIRNKLRQLVIQLHDIGESSS